jgi:NAD(P)H-hydrate epimerase
MGDTLYLSRAEVREFDRRAIEKLGLPGAVLMENAGAGAARHVLELLRSRVEPARSARVAIACGAGNNGGDGYVVARHLAIAGCEVELFSTCAANALRGDAALQRGIVERMGLAVRSLATAGELDAFSKTLARCDASVDALLGTGSVGPPRADLAAVIERLDAARGVPCIALDLPSGLDCDSGEAPGVCVHAALTVTFVAHKRGFANPRAAACLGRVEVVGIGVPLESNDPRPGRVAEA